VTIESAEIYGEDKILSTRRVIDFHMDVEIRAMQEHIAEQ
jgi:hypothetical protein